MFKKIWNWLKNPRIWWFIIVLVLLAGSICGAVICIARQNEGGITEYIAYVMYALSAILLTYAVFCIIKLAPRAKAGLKAWALKHEFTKKILEQYGFRTIVFAVVSFAISAANAAINLTMGIIWVSVWFISLGIYYLMLAVMRGGVLLYHGKKKNYTEGEIAARQTKTYLVCGVWLTALPIALSGAVWEIVGSDMAFVRSGLMIYAAAAYTFYKIIMSVYNFAKARKNDDMTVRAIRNVNLADATVSVLALQTAMFREFASGENTGLANAVMGAVVCALTAAIGVFMIVNASLKLKKKDTEKETEDERGQI